LGLAGPLCADDWPQWRGPGRDGVWRETGVIRSFDGPRIRLRWRAAISAGYCGPTVADGRVYVADRVTRPEERERIHCFRWTDGRKLWSVEYPCTYRGIGYRAGPRASITVHDGRAYVLGAVGHFHCLDAATGRILWEKDLADQFAIDMPHWGLAAAPLVEGDLVILMIGGQDACVVAFDRRSGQLRWKALDDPASYSAPIVIDQAGHRVLVCWTGTRIVGLDPRTGQPFWDQRYNQPRWVISIATPVLEGDRLFFSSFYNGSILLRVPRDRLAVEKLWHRAGPDEYQTEALHSLMVTPYFEGDYIYGVDSYGQLRCLEAATGDRIWEDRTATSQVRWGTLHMVRHEPTGNMWMFNDRGELIIARLSPAGFYEISRTRLLRPTREQLRRGDGVCWSHPAFAYRHVFNRNDEELVCASLAAETPAGAEGD